MKKLAVILFSTFYLLVTAGATFTIHYCHGKIQSVEVIVEVDRCCCPPSAEDTCCKDESYYVQLEDEQLPSQNFRNIPSEVELAVFSALVNNFHFNDEEGEVYSGYTDSLPPKKQQPIWLLNCSLTYFG